MPAPMMMASYTSSDAFDATAFLRACAIPSPLFDRRAA
jgi:hypothetical protein